MVLVAATLSACDEGSGTAPPDSHAIFLRSTLLSGDSPAEWNYIWGCEIFTRAGNYRGVPLRFYRDGQLLAGIGSSTISGTWSHDPVDPTTAKTAVYLTLDESAPQLFGSEHRNLLFNLWTETPNYMVASGGVMVADGLPENTTLINLLCGRYNKAGDLAAGDDGSGWYNRLEDTPTFITTGEADVQFEPATSSQPDDDNEEDTTPASDQPVSEPITRPTTVDTPPATRPAATAPLGDITAQIKDIWYTGDFVDTIDGVRQWYDSIIEFKNGEASDDGETISNEGIAASKRKNPEDWGEARVLNGLLSYKFSDDRGWEEPYLSAPTRAYPRNQKITGCYSNSSGIEGTGSTPVINRICFAADGGFEVGDAGNVTGNYLIDGHAIRLDFSNGEREEFLFGAHYREEFIYRLIIADAVFHVSR